MLPGSLEPGSPAPVLRGVRSLLGAALVARAVPNPCVSLSLALFIMGSIVPGLLTLVLKVK